MPIKANVKKILFLIKVKINKIPIIRKFIIMLLSNFPSFYEKLQKIDPTISNQIEEEKAILSSSHSEQFFKDIKNAINYNME